MESLTSNKFIIVPCCNHCHAINKTDTKWTTWTGKMPITTEKLIYCGKCYLSFYCNASCELENIENKLHCNLIDYADTPLMEGDIREVVQKIENLQPGKLILYINFTNNQAEHYQHTPNINQDILLVELKINNRIQGSLSYLCVKNEEPIN